LRWRLHVGQLCYTFTAMSDRYLVVGTAGHVDHGKTALIKALTGINTDRLREEQERGMSIELGFAHLTLPSGIQVGIVDVPGHERFLKNMLAGASGMDLVMMVVAADEGVMPQTIEHLDILRLLQVKDGLVVLTKIDLVDQDWLDVVQEDIRQRFSGSFLASAPIVPVSSVTGEGLENLVAVLDEKVRAVPTRSPVGPFRMPVDRIFSMPGFGTVVAGTVWSGTVSLGDALELQPAGLSTRARGLQVHGRKVERASAGTRLAVNIAGVEVSQVSRGSVLVQPGWLKPTYLLDAELLLLERASHSLKHRTRIRLHTGTAEVIGRVAILDRDELLPGDSAPVQFQLESPVAVARGDLYILRLYSPMETLGGGTILDPYPKRHRRHDERVLQKFRVLKGGSLEVQAAQVLAEQGLVPTSAEDVASRLALDLAQARRILADLEAVGLAFNVGGGYLHSSAVEEAAKTAEQVLKEYHQANPLRLGMGREELKSRVAPKCSSKVWAALLELWASQGRIKVDESTVSDASHSVIFSPEQERTAQVILELYLRSGYSPPSREEVLKAVESRDASDVFDALVEQGILVKIAEGLYLHKDSVSAAEERLRLILEAQGTITVAQFRDVLESSRKVVVPLLEYFDSRGVTRRVGDVRVKG
jgi:selenocysteine-specific elongation factor